MRKNDKPLFKGNSWVTMNIAMANANWFKHFKGITQKKSYSPEDLFSFAMGNTMDILGSLDNE